MAERRLLGALGRGWGGPTEQQGTEPEVCILKGEATFTAGLLLGKRPQLPLPTDCEVWENLLSGATIQSSLPYLPHHPPDLLLGCWGGTLGTRNLCRGAGKEPTTHWH